MSCLQAPGLQRDGLTEAMGISFTVSTLALAAGRHANSRYAGAAPGASVVTRLAALAGMAVGQRLRQRLSPELLRKCFLGSLILLGIYMIADNVSAAPQAVQVEAPPAAR